MHTNRTLLSAAVLVATAFAAGALLVARSGDNAARAATAAPAPSAKSPSAEPTQAERVARGKHLVFTSACNDCHTPWKMGDRGLEPDMSRLLSGHPEGVSLAPPPALEGGWVMAGAATNTAYAGPWGVSYTANLTPDRETGLGTWSEATFIATIRTGRHLGRGRPVLPPMPIGVYQNFTDEELKSIFAYLQTIPSIRNRVPEPVPPPAPKQG